MSDRTVEERSLVRAAAERAVVTEQPGPYRTLARGTLAALDWVEGRTDVAPCTLTVARPDDLIARGRYEVPAISNELDWAEDWGSGYVRPPREDLHFHGAVWTLLRWWLSSRQPSSALSIWVPGLTD